MHITDYITICLLLVFIIILFCAGYYTLKYIGITWNGLLVVLITLKKGGI